MSVITATRHTSLARLALIKEGYQKWGINLNYFEEKIAGKKGTRRNTWIYLFHILLYCAGKSREGKRTEGNEEGRATNESEGNRQTYYHVLWAKCVHVDFICLLFFPFPSLPFSSCLSLFFNPSLPEPSACLTASPAPNWQALKPWPRKRTLIKSLPDCNFLEK